MAIESLFPMDIAMDFSVLAAVQSALDRPCLKRLIRAQMVLLFFTILCLVFPAAGAAMQFAAYPLAAIALLGRRRPLVILEAAGGIFCAYAAAAGFTSLAGKTGILAFLGLIVFSLLLRRRGHIRFRWNIELLLEANGTTACFPALIDTGNRLREHRSGLPVLIAEESVLGEIVHAVDPEECTSLPYGVLGSAGEILCFSPDALSIRAAGGLFIPAPECLVAIFPGKIPGRICALAPPEFAGYVEHRFQLSTAVQNTLRRFHYGVFKRKTIHLRPGCTASPRLGMLHRRQ